MFPLSGGQFVVRDDFPAVGVLRVDENFPRAHINHRFDGEHHSRNEEHSVALLLEMSHFGFFVEGTPYPMAAEIADDAVVVGSFSGVVLPMMNIRDASA